MKKFKALNIKFKSPKAAFANLKENYSREFKQGHAKRATTSTILTIFIVVVLILVNMLVGIVDDKFSLNVDLTTSGFNTLSAETIQYISNIDKEISINVMNPKAAFCAGESSITNSTKYFTQASNIIDQFGKYSDKITVNYIDTVNDPGFTTKFPEHKFYGNELVIIVDGRNKIIDSYELFNFNNSNNYSYSYGISSSKAEQVITSAILNMTSSDKTKATFLKGYSEDDYSSLKTLLEDNNYSVEETEVLGGDIPEDTKLLIIFAPKKDYDNLGIEKINDFIENSNDNGVGIVYVANANSENHKNINKFLKNYGMSVESGIAYSTDKKTQMASNNGYIPYYCSTTYASEEYTEGLANTTSPVVAAQSHPIKIEDSSKATSLLDIATGGVSKSQFSDYNEKANESNICVAAISKNETSQGSGKYNYVMTIGSNLNFYEDLLSYTSLNNSVYFTNVFNKITSTESGVVIAPKTAESAQLGASAFQAYTIAAILVILIPLIILIYGIIVWAVRRHR